MLIQVITQQHSTTQYNPVQPSATQYNTVQPSTTQYNPVQPSTTQYNPTQPNPTRICYLFFCRASSASLLGPSSYPNNVVG